MQKNLGKSSSIKKSKGSNAKGLQAKLIKGSKSVKGRRISFKLYYNYGTDKLRNISHTHKIVVKALSNCRLSAKHIETGRRLIKRFLSRKINLNVRVYPFVAVTKRPHDVRMGKGKGTRITDWIYPIKSGKILYEIVPVYIVKSRLVPQASKQLFAQTVMSVFEKLNLKFPIPVKALLLEL